MRAARCAAVEAKPIMAALATSSRLATFSRRPVEAGFTTARLMEYSEQFLWRTAQSQPGQTSQASQPQTARLAARLLKDKPLHQRWAREHGRLMHGVAAPTRPADKVTELRKVTFLTLHRKAPFEYLRDRHVVGAARRYLIRALFGSQDYAQCLVREHLAFMSSACSFMCADALCGEVLGDAAFSTALAHYQNAYTEYYRAYGDSLLAAHTGAQSGDSASAQSLLPYLRYQLKTIREHMVSGNPQQSDFATLQALYQATGDTQTLPIISPKP
jgi:hypothetical protein